MGQEIVYCAACATRLLTSDFEKGRAFRLGNRVACLDCAPALGVSADEIKLASQKTPPGGTPRATSSGRIPAYQPRSGTARVPLAELPAPRKSSTLPLVLGGLGALLAMIAALVALGNLRTPQTPLKPDVQPVRVTQPPPLDDAKTTAARKLLADATAYARNHPNDLDGQIAAYAAALKEAMGTPVYPQARDAHDALVSKRMAEIPRELDRLYEEAKPFRDREEFKAAIGVYERARARKNAPEWPGLVDGKIREIRETAARELEGLKVSAADAKAKGKPDDAKKARARVEKWGLPELLSELDAHLAGIAEPRPPSPEEIAYLARWKALMARATAGDLEGALAELRKDKHAPASDVDDLAQALAVRQESWAALAAAPRGASLSLDYKDAKGSKKKLSGKVVQADGARIELEGGFVEIEDLTIGTLGKQAKSAPKRALAVLHYLAGDLPSSGSYPAKYAEYAKTVKPLRPSARELEARALVYQAEREFRNPEALHLAVEKYKRLLSDYADTRAVGRSDLGLWRKRAEAGREVLLLADALRGAGVFRAGAWPKVEQAWTAAADGDGQKDGVEAEVALLADTPYRAWAYVGGCCMETFGFSFQAGDEKPQKARLGIAYLKSTHAGHGGGPKEPRRWEWVPLPLPAKFPAGGPKKFRLLGEQQGFSVAAVFVSAARHAPPGEAEMKGEFERLKGAEAPDPSLLGHWKLDDAAAEAAGRWKGDLKGGAWTPGGRKGGALLFEKPGAIHADDFAFPGGEISLAAWVRHDGWTGKVERYVTVEPEVAVLRHENKPGAAQFYVKTDNKLRHLLVENVLKLGQWHHVAGTWDGKAQRLYVDGKPVAKAEPGGKLGAGQILRVSSLTEPLKGAIDDVRVYARALKPEEVEVLAGLRIAAAPEAPAGPWKPVFDGKTADCMNKSSRAAWKVEDGALVQTADDAGQTVHEFGDAEVRLRFQADGAAALSLKFRQAGKDGYRFGWSASDLAPLAGQVRELLVVAKGDQVTATLDGRPVALEAEGAPRRGVIQINGRGKGFRILSLEYRDLR